MINVTIEQVRETYFVVRGTTERFGENEVMFEAITLTEAKRYADRYNKGEAVQFIGFDADEEGYINALAEIAILRTGFKRKSSKLELFAKALILGLVEGRNQYNKFTKRKLVEMLGA